LSSDAEHRQGFLRSEVAIWTEVGMHRARAATVHRILAAGPEQLERDVRVAAASRDDQGGPRMSVARGQAPRGIADVDRADAGAAAEQQRALVIEVRCDEAGNVARQRRCLHCHCRFGIVD
jgi:hypothetical protein